MYFLDREEFRKPKDFLKPSIQSVRLGLSTNPLNTQSLTIVPSIGRAELNRGTMPNLVGGYSSIGLDLNPFDLAYRAEEKTDYYIDFGSLLVRTAWAASSGGSTEAAKTIGKQIFFLFS